MRALLTERQQRGSVFVPFHWTDASSANARIDALVTPVTDPVSGQPASKSSRVAVRPFAAAFYGYAVMGERQRPDTDYFALARIPNGWAVEFAGRQVPDDPHALAQRLLGRADLCGVVDGAAGSSAFAAFDGERCAGAIYLSRRPVAASRAFVNAHLGEDVGRAAILAGRPGLDQPDPGPTVCACFKVGANQIKAAARAGAGSVAAIGEALGAGTNCGSCRGEIASLLVEVAADRIQQGMDHDADARANAR